MHKLSTPSRQQRLDAYVQLKKGLQHNPTRLSRIGLGSAFLLGLPVATLAAVQVRTINQTVNSTSIGGSTVQIDIDNDGNHEILFGVFADAILFGGGGQPGFGFVTQYTGPTFPYIARLAPGDTIQSTSMNPIPINTTFALTYTNSGSPRGAWLDDATTAYAGFRFLIGGNVHFGWMELQVTDVIPGPGQVVISRWAWEDQPNLGIQAGSMVSLPVELTSFTAKPTKESIALHWQTATEQDNAGFEVQRSEDGKTFKTLAFVEGRGTTLEQQDYFYDDKALRAGQRYYYRLKQIDFDGAFEYSEVITATVEGAAKPTAVVSPNPVQQGFTQVSYTALEAGTIQLQVFDAKGRTVLQQTQNLEEGITSLDLNLSQLAPGVYFLKMQQGTQQLYEKVLVE